jgi:hypothetical protein
MDALRLPSVKRCADRLRVEIRGHDPAETLDAAEFRDDRGQGGSEDRGVERTEQHDEHQPGEDQMDARLHCPVKCKGASVAASTGRAGSPLVMALLATLCGSM